MIKETLQSHFLIDCKNTLSVIRNIYHAKCSIVEMTFLCCLEGEKTAVTYTSANQTNNQVFGDVLLTGCIWLQCAL